MLHSGRLLSNYVYFIFSFSVSCLDILHCHFALEIRPWMLFSLCFWCLLVPAVGVCLKTDLHKRYNPPPPTPSNWPDINCYF